MNSFPLSESSDTETLFLEIRAISSQGVYPRLRAAMSASGRRVGTSPALASNLEVRFRPRPLHPIKTHLGRLEQLAKSAHRACHSSTGTVCAFN